MHGGPKPDSEDSNLISPNTLTKIMQEILHYIYTHELLGKRRAPDAAQKQQKKFRQPTGVAGPPHPHPMPGSKVIRNYNQMPPPPVPSAINKRHEGQNLTVPQKFVFQVSKLMPAIVESNPYVKEQVGTLIYEYVVDIIGNQKAPKITGMLIELPVSQILLFLYSYETFKMKVHEANSLLIAKDKKPERKERR